jgi:hypothetical protein
MIQLVIILVIAAAALGGGFFKVQQWKSEARQEGREQCQAEVKAADDRVKVAADALAEEVAKHESDLALADKLLDAKATERIVYREKKGAVDVTKYPVFQNPVCVLPDDALRNLNAARAGIRREPPAVSVRAGSDGPSSGAGPAANPGGPAGSVRGADGATGGAPKGPVPAGAGGRGPLGKVHPKG